MPISIRRTFPAMLAVALCCCSGGPGPSDPLRKTGAFVLSTPVVGGAFEGYNILDDYPANAHSLYDVRLFGFARQDSVNIMANWYAGGILPANGRVAPDYPYPRGQTLDLRVSPSYPLYFFLRCKDNKHYCRLVLDSLALTRQYDTRRLDTVDVGSGYFSYTLNLDDYEREF